MMMETILKNFDEITSSPAGILLLRRFIIDIAIRGKLIPQLSSDESAKALLSRIPSEVERLQLKIMKKKALTAPHQPTLDEALPSGWASVMAREIFITRSGNSKLIKGTLHSTYNEKYFPGYSAAGQDTWLDDWEHEGDAIILSAVGARCGKAFLASGKWSAIANTHIVWVLPQITYPQFALLHLNNEKYWIRNGGAQPFIKVKETLERTFALPPLKEQIRIVERVSTLMSLCDTLEKEITETASIRHKLTETLLVDILD